MPPRTNIQTIGQPSPASIQLSAQRNNRLLTAMQEAEATKRQGMANRTQTAVAGMQQAGANQRAQLSERGAGQRATLAADVSREGQQVQRDVSEAGIEASDRQQAAELRARRELEEFRSAEARERQVIDQEFQQVQFEQRKALAEQDLVRYEQAAAKDRDFRWGMALLDYQGQIRNSRMMMGAIRKSLTNEVAEEKLIERCNTMVRNWQAKAVSYAKIDAEYDGILDADPAINALATRQPTDVPNGNASEIDRAFFELTRAQGVPTQLDTLLDPAKTDELQTQAAGWSLTQSYAVVHAAESLKAKLIEQLEASKESGPHVKKPGKRGVAMGFGGPVNAMTTYGTGKGYHTESIKEQIRRLDNAVRNIDSLASSTRPLDNGKVTLGQQMKGFRMSHRGATAEAAMYYARLTSPDENSIDETLRLMEEIERMPLTPDMALMKPFAGNVSPEMLARVNAFNDSTGQAVQGYRIGPTAGPFDPTNYTTPYLRGE